MFAPQEVVVGQAVPSPPIAHVLAAPPPAAVTWHLPHTPIATVLAPAADAALPQNGAVATAPVPVVHEVPEHWKSCED